VWLVDELVKVVQDVKANQNYLISHASEKYPRRLKLVIGKRDYVQDQLEQMEVIPTSYALYQNFPNPFNPATTIRYALPVEGQVTLKVYDILGREVAVLLDKAEKPSGYHAEIWDGRNRNGVKVASGVYLYSITVNRYADVKKMIFLR
jgi:hypothetical protein